MPQFKRYEKQMPDHHVQVDVKFLFFKDAQGNRIKPSGRTMVMSFKLALIGMSGIWEWSMSILNPPHQDPMAMLSVLT